MDIHTLDNVGVIIVSRLKMPVTVDNTAYIAQFVHPNSAKSNLVCSQSVILRTMEKPSSESFKGIWHELARIMHQNPSDKTIVFSMKCLGISLLMTGEYEFNFVHIPIPVDSRVMKFTNQLGFPIITDDDVRALWSDVFSILRKNDSRINMIHLDSLVWQVASMSEYELRDTLET